MHNFLLADCLCRINNGQRIYLESVDIQYSSFCIKVLLLLYYEGYISGFSILSKTTVRVFLKYFKNKPISLFRIISKPGHRIYISYKKLNQFNFVIVSTSKGILSTNLAKFFKKGGELLFSIELL